MHRPVKKISLIALIAAASLFLNQSHSHEQGGDSIQVQITTDPWKSLVVCARNVQVIEGAVLLPAEDESPGIPVSKAVFITAFQALLQLSSPHPCTKEQTRHHPYQAKKIIYSEWPFLAEFVPGGAKKKKFRPPASAEGGWPFPFNPANRYSRSGGSGGTFGPDDDQQHKRPYGFFSETSGDIDLSLLGGFQLPQVMGDYPPDHTTWQAVLSLLGMGNERSQTLWVYLEGQPESLSSIQVNSSEMKELVSSLGGGSVEKKLAWLRQKLYPDQKQALLQQLLVLQDIFSAGDAVLSEPVLELIRGRLVEVFGKTSAEIDLEFEFFRLHRDLEELAGEVTKSLVLAHRPNPKVVYEGGEVEKLMHQAGQTTSREGQAGRGEAQGNAGGNGGNQQQGRDNQDAPGQAGDNAGNNGVPQGQDPEEGVDGLPQELTIAFVGKAGTGKSTLASRLIGFPHFPVDQEPIEKEGDYYFRGLRIRSLPGFPDEDSRTYIQDNGIGRDDIVVFVLDDDLTDGVVAGMVTALKNNGNKIIFVKNQIGRVVGDPDAVQRAYRERFDQQRGTLGISAPLIFTSVNFLEEGRAASIDELENHLYVLLTGSPFRRPSNQVTPVTGLSDHLYSFLAGRRFQVFQEFQKSRLRIRHFLAGEIMAKSVLDVMRKVLENPGVLESPEALGDRAFFIRAIREAITNTHPFLDNYDISIKLNESQKAFLESIMENIDQIFRGRVREGVGEGLTEEARERVREETKKTLEEDIRFYLKACGSIVLKKHQGYSKGWAAVAGSVCGGLLAHFLAP